MRSPFPCMDPYLERPDRWSGVHAALISVAREMLTRQVAPRFFVDSEDSVYILGLDDPGRSYMRPDLYLVEAAAAGASLHSRGRITSPALLDLPAALELHVPHLTVVDTADRQVVATIEVLSPINKTPGSSGRRDFLLKRENVLRSSAHWLEIDLLRAGTRLPGIPPRGAYAAALHRAAQYDRVEVWFMELREPLQTVALPLRPPFEDVPLDLQELVDTVYDRYRYDAALDYAEPPPLPEVSAPDAAWARERIVAG